MLLSQRRQDSIPIGRAVVPEVTGGNIDVGDGQRDVRSPRLRTKAAVRCVWGFYQQRTGADVIDFCRQCVATLASQDFQHAVVRLVRAWHATLLR